MDERIRLPIFGDDKALLTAIFGGDTPMEPLALYQVAARAISSTLSAW